MTLRLVEHDVEEQVNVLHPDVLPDIDLIQWLVHRDEIQPWMTSRDIGWEISHRVLRVQRWARYYGLTTRAFTALATGLYVSTRR